MINIIRILNSNGIILTPTDTIYGLSCDATNSNAVKKIYALKNRKESKSLIVLVNEIEMLKKHVSEIPEQILAYLENNTEPITVIYSNPKKIASNLLAKDNTIAIRIVKKGFIYDLITKFNKPIVSTSANVSGEKTPLKFEEINKTIIDGVDFFVNLPIQLKNNKPSTIIKFINNKIQIIRA